MIERFPTAEERWPSQGSTMPYSLSKLKLDMAYKKAEKMMSRYKKKK